ncbi:MAG: FAD-linked oxidase C-terminal domain-containing protein [Planctomycetota bacterium]
MDILERLERLIPPDRLARDPAAVLVYEFDAWPVRRTPPLAVVHPRSTDEVRAVVEACRDAKVPFLARGSGTGLSGGATPAGEGYLMIAMAGMDRILALDAEDRTARVQPGLFNLALSEAAAPHGLRFAPDPSSQAASTIGGNVSENAGGPHCFLHGMTTDHVLGLVLVTPEAEVLELERGAGPDLCGLVVGHEGTFGIVTEVLLRLVPQPGVVETWLAPYPTMSAACRAVSDLVASGLSPSALEILDRNTIEAVEASVYAAGYPREAEAVLLVEWEGSEAALAAESPAIVDRLRAHGPLGLEATRDPVQRKRLWKGRKGAFGAMGRLAPSLFVLDGTVPRSRLEEALARSLEIGRAHGVRLSNVFHAGDGNLHPNISFDDRDPAEVARAIAAGSEILRTCVELGGSISGEHGVGLEKLDFLGFQYSETDLEVFRELRRCFDPDERCNPGKLLPAGGSCAEGRSARAPAALEGGDG